MTSASTELWFVVPNGIDDVRRPSGGNVYDRRLAEKLAATGWRVRLVRTDGAWPRPSDTDQAVLARRLSRLPDGARVLVDGLIGSAATALQREAERLCIVVLVHMPLGEASEDPAVGALEGAVLRRARAVITTSQWSRRWVVAHHRVAAERVRVALPGVDRGPLATGSPTGGRLLCVGPVTPAKGHDLLVAALRDVRHLPWHCTVVGALDLDPPFVDQLRTTAADAGIGERIRFLGPVEPQALDEIRDTTDLAVSASRRESYGMAVAEALARGIPVIATAVGGHPEVLGGADARPLAGVVVPTADHRPLAAALRRWLSDDVDRRRLRAAAARRRSQLAGWSDAARVVGEACGEPPLNRSGAPTVLPLAAPDVDDGRRRST